jgi:integrase
VPVGNWITAERGKRFILTADDASLRGKRDYAILAILLGCGLRRAEWTALRKVIWGVVKKKAKDCEIQSLAPHDLRRTCARLCHQAGGELEQIQFLLGHVSVQTTERYLGCKQRFRNAVNDHIGLEPDQGGDAVVENLIFERWQRSIPGS